MSFIVMIFKMSVGDFTNEYKTFKIQTINLFFIKKYYKSFYCLITYVLRSWLKILLAYFKNHNNKSISCIYFLKFPSLNKLSIKENRINARRKF